MTTVVLDGLSFQDKATQENIKQVQARTAKPSVYREIGGLFDTGALLIEKQWSSFTDDQKDALEHFAYHLLSLAPDNGGGLSSFLAKIRINLLKLRGKEKDLYYCVRAIDKFVDSILCSIEADSSSYKDMLVEVSSDLSDGSFSGREVKDRREWLRDLSDQVLR